MKKCTTCGSIKDESQFNKDKQKKDGLNPRCRDCSRKWHHKNKERVKEYQQGYYEKTKEYHSDKAKKYREANREKLVSSSKEWHAKNKDRAKAYRKERIYKYRVHAANRRARIIGNGGTHTKSDIDFIFKNQKGRCAICGCELSDYHVDHITPIARGGSNSPSNLQVTCPPCNFSKNDKDPIEFMQSKGFLL